MYQGSAPDPEAVPRPRLPERRVSPELARQQEPRGAPAVPVAASLVPLPVLQQVLEGLRALPDTPPSEPSEKTEKTGKPSGMRGEVGERAW